MDYIFLTSDQFDRMVEQDGFLEWAHVYGNRYGVPKDQVRKALEQGRDVLLKAGRPGRGHDEAPGPGGRVHLPGGAIARRA